MIQREKYLDWLRRLQDHKLIKVVTGVRRSGKSTLLELFREDLRKRGVKKAQIQSFNFEQEKNADLLDWRVLHQHIERKLVPDAMNYIFLDEIQNVPGFERCVVSLASEENIDVYITGSNALMLSGELATHLTGRYITIHMLPFSFAEYAENFPEVHIRDLIGKYLGASSFPEAVNLAKDGVDLADKYISDLYNLILTRDIVPRYKIKNPELFEKVFKYVLSSIGSPLSAHNIANVLTAQGDAISDEKVAQYLDYLAKVYLIYPVSRFDIKGRNILTSNKKYYTVDLGLRTFMLGEPQGADMGHRLENTVYLELLRRSEGKIYVGKQGEKGVDFIVQRFDGGMEYYQVAYQIGENEETLTREMVPLLSVKDNYPKTIISGDPMNENINGIRKINIADWLLGKE